MGVIELGANRYGKRAIRLVKVVRDPAGHRVRDLTVDVALEGDFAAAHTAGDNALVVATDTMKNTVYALAAEHLTGAIEAFIRHPQAMIATDGVMIGAKPAPRTYGTYPRILGELVREARLLGLEEAVRKMTGASAARLGLADRGVVADGFRADLVLFDPARVRALATYEEPRRYPEGIPYVLVNGVLVVDGGEHTGATPGRALRRGHPD